MGNMRSFRTVQLEHALIVFDLYCHFTGAPESPAFSTPWIGCHLALALRVLECPGMPWLSTAARLSSTKQMGAMPTDIFSSSWKNFDLKTVASLNRSRTYSMDLPDLEFLRAHISAGFDPFLSMMKVVPKQGLRKRDLHH